MITAKRILCGALALCMILLLVSCQKADENYPFDPLLEGESGPIAAYRIVLPADCSAALYEKAEALAALLAERVGASVTVNFDYDTVLGEDVPELLLGYTSRSLSREYLTPLRKDDYLCRSDGKGGAIIGGRTDEATRAAVDRFCEEILPTATAECLMYEGAGFSYVGSYPSEQFLLNGFALDRYCLVYPHGADAELCKLIRRFRDEIAARSGYVLDIFSDAEIHGVEKQIRLTEELQDTREHLAYIDPTPSGIEISSHGLYGFSVGLLELERLLFPSETDGTVQCHITRAHSIPYERDEYRIGCAQTSDEALSLASIIDLLLPIRERLPDGVVLNEMEQSSLKRVEDNLSHEGYQGLSTENGDRLPAFSKGAVLTAIGISSAWDGGPSVAVYRAGSEKYGFYLIRISGEVSADDVLELPQEIRDSALPAVVLIHVKQTGGELSFAADSYGMRAWCNDRYSVEGESYLFQCYATDGSLEGTVIDGGTRYREITVKQSSVY